jgi:hypothetical protein
MICDTYSFYEEFGFYRSFYLDSCDNCCGNVVGDSSEGTLQERYDYVKSVLEAEDNNG